MKSLGLFAFVMMTGCAGAGFGGESVESDVHALSVSVDGVDVFAGSYDAATGEVFLVSDLLDLSSVEGVTLDGSDLEWQGAIVAPGMGTGEAIELRTNDGQTDLILQDASWVDGLNHEEAESRMATLCADFGLV